MKRFFAIILFFAVTLCSCGNPAGQGMPNAATEEPNESSPWKNFTDLSGDAITIEEEDIKSLNLTYAMGWNFDAEGYRTIRRGDTMGNGTVIETASAYHIQYKEDPFYNREIHADGLPGIICNGNAYWIECNDTISGVIQISGDSVAFFPYDNPGNNFLLLCIRDEENEKIFSESSYIHVNDSNKVKVQPIGIVLQMDSDDNIVSEISGFEADKNLIPQYYDADVNFLEIGFSAISDGEGAEIFGTRASGRIESIDSISVKSKLSR